MQLFGNLQQTLGAFASFLAAAEWKHGLRNPNCYLKTLFLIFTVKGAFWRRMSVFCGSFLLQENGSNGFPISNNLNLWDMSTKCE